MRGRERRKRDKKNAFHRERSRKLPAQEGSRRSRTDLDCFSVLGRPRGGSKEGTREEEEKISGDANRVIGKGDSFGEVALPGSAVSHIDSQETAALFTTRHQPSSKKRPKGKKRPLQRREGNISLRKTGSVEGGPPRLMKGEKSPS